jgi:anti-sigma B factor antagonist
MWKLLSRITGSQRPEPEPARLVLQDPESDAEPVQRGIAAVEHVGSSTVVATLTVTELTQEQGVNMMAELLQELIDSGAVNFVLDIQNVQYMDSACLGCLVEALNRVSSMGGRIALANTHHSVEYLFRLTRLDRVFPICGNVVAALDLLQKPAPVRGRR